MAYFHPWVIEKEDACEHVPTFWDLAAVDEKDEKNWSTACSTWLAGNVLTLEMKVLLQNFFAVTRARPDDKEVERTQRDKEISDQDLDLEGHDLEQLLQTTPGGRKGTRKRKADDHHKHAVAAIAYARDRWRISTSQARRTADCAANLCVEPERDDIRCRGTASCWRGI